ncbi:MAG TPA: thiamine pyrophosphate-binding protein, partial [Acidimicrobiales bacterium]|nr:thiamine pyrophosphate-binding protein [Acidimicrobiales bacterium]
MPQSVPSPSQVQATYAATLFDEWIRLGLRDVVLCPGSRSTPLALACASRGELRVHVRIDERSAGFFALGRALATREPVAIVVTSGTAAAELHACVAEASQAFVPLLVLTADRPPELHGVGAPQT